MKASASHMSGRRQSGVFTGPVIRLYGSILPRGRARRSIRAPRRAHVRDPRSIRVRLRALHRARRSSMNVHIHRGARHAALFQWPHAQR